MKKFWYQYKCYGIKIAPELNRWLIWSIIPIAIITYLFMYHIIDANNISDQWYAYFVGNSIQHFILSLIVYVSFKETRHAGMSTAVLIYSFFKFIESLFSLHQKMPYIDMLFKLLILGLITYVITDMFRKFKNETHTTKSK